MQQRKNNVIKLQDTFGDLNSASDKHNREYNIQKLYKRFRSAAPFPKKAYYDGEIVDLLSKTFGLKGIQFGNWLTTEDRYNYSLALYSCLYDMNKVLNFKTKNLGLSQSLAVALGSRGVPNSLAHYEGDNFVINITRYKRKDRLLVPMPKEWRFINTGGSGSFGHEYGHFLDNAFGLWSDQHINGNWLTGDPHSMHKEPLTYNKRTNPIRAQLEVVFKLMLWEKDGNRSAFHKRITSQSDYYNRRCEMFARLFEVYLSIKLKQKGIYNSFLVKRKYVGNMYLTEKEMKPIIPEMDKLISLLRARS